MSCEVGFINVKLDGDCDDLQSYFSLVPLFSIVAVICAAVTVWVTLKKSELNMSELKCYQGFSILFTLVLGVMSIVWSAIVLDYDTDPIIGWAVVFLVLGIVSVIIACISILDLVELAAPCEKLLAYRKVNINGLNTDYKEAGFDIA